MGMGILPRFHPTDFDRVLVTVAQVSVFLHDPLPLKEFQNVSLGSFLYQVAGEGDNLVKS